MTSASVRPSSMLGVATEGAALRRSNLAVPGRCGAMAMLVTLVETRSSAESCGEIWLPEGPWPLPLARGGWAGGDGDWVGRSLPITLGTCGPGYPGLSCRPIKAITEPPPGAALTLCYNGNHPRALSSVG